MVFVRVLVIFIGADVVNDSDIPSEAPSKSTIAAGADRNRVRDQVYWLITCYSC